MAWNHYYINMEKLYDPENCPEDLGVFWEQKIPPLGGIRQEWTTTGMKAGRQRRCAVHGRL